MISFELLVTGIYIFQFPQLFYVITII